MANTSQPPKETLAGAKPGWDNLDGPVVVKGGPGWVELIVCSGVKMYNSSTDKRREKN